MASRRGRRSYRRGRGPRRQLMWLRDATNSALTITQGTLAVVDLLWLLRNPPVAGALLEDGQRLTRAPETGNMAVKDPTGITIMRTHLTVRATLDSAAPNPDDGLFIGIIGSDQAIPAGSATAAQGTGADPRTEIGANSADWMWWERLNFLDARTSFLFEQTTGAFQSVTMIHDIDCKAKRRLRDWGDTPKLYMSPSLLTAGQGWKMTAVWSTLLALP